MVAAYCVLRTVAAPESALLAWIAGAILVTLCSPLAGLTMLAALGPFTEAQTADGRITAVPYLLAATGASLLLHVLITRSLPRLSVPLILAMALLVGTAVGVGVSAANYGLTLGIDGLQLWVPGIGGGLTVLLVAAWVAWRGDIRPLFVAVAAISVGALISVVDALTNDMLLNSPLGWLLRFDVDPRRLGGLIPSPNTAAGLFIVGIVMTITIAMLARGRARRWVRTAAVSATIVQAVALFLTYSRSGYVALGVAVVLLLWRRWPRWGGRVLLLALAIVVPFVLYGWLIRGVPLAFDENRLLAWQATSRMWLDNPILGTGFRSFEWLHAAYGSALLDAPHSEWLRLFGEGGTIVGLIGIAFAITTPIVLLRAPSLLVAGTGAAAAGLFLLAALNNPFLNSQLNVSAFLVIGTGLGIAARRAGHETAVSDHPGRLSLELFEPGS